MNVNATPAGTGADNYRWWVLATAVFGAFVSIMDATVVVTALPRLQTIFGVDLRQISYVATAYTLAQGVVVAASAYLATRFGIKPVYLTSLALFTAGSALCGLATSAPMLIAFRVLQGAGGAALVPLAFSLVLGAFPPAQRGLANGVFGIPVLAAPALGPTVGGYLVQYVDWRWIFYLNVPIGVAGALLGWRVLRPTPPQRGLPFDLRGFLLLAPALGLLLFGLSNLSYDGPGALMTVSGPLVAAALLLAVYVPVELGTARPLLDLRLFARRNYWAGSLIAWVSTVGLFGASFLLPQYLQALRGLSPYDAGLLLLPQGLAAIAGTVAAGALYTRVDPRILIVGGAVAMAAATFLLGAWSTLTSAVALLAPLLVLRGLAVPALTQTAGTVALQGIEGAALPGANTLSVVTRSVVSSLAVAGLVNLLQSRQLAHAGALAAGGHATRAVARQAQALAYQDVYVVAGVVAVAAVVLPLLLRPERPTAAAQVAAAGGAASPAAAAAAALPAR